LRRIIPLLLVLAILPYIPGCGVQSYGGDNQDVLLYDIPRDSQTAVPAMTLPPLTSEPDGLPKPEASETHEPTNESPDEQVDAPPPLTMQGDWAGYIFGEPEYDWDDGRQLVALLRMQDEEHGVLGFCADMTDKGSGCATVSVSYISDNEIHIKVDKWFYRTAHNEYTILPRDFSINMEYWYEPTEADSEEYRDLFYSTKTPFYHSSSPGVLAGISEGDELIDLRFCKINEDYFPVWYHQYDGLNDCLEGVFGFGESGADNIRTSNVFVFPLGDGSFRLRYIYAELGHPVMSDNGDWGIPEYSMEHWIDAGGYLSMYPWVCFWYPKKDTTVVNASKKFTAFYENQYIPDLVRSAQAYKWEDGFEKIDVNEWGEDHYWDYLKIVMYKKLIFTAQEVIAGRFDGDPYKVGSLVDKRYKPGAVKLEHYYPENDPNAYILHADLDEDGEEETLVIRAYRRDGNVEMLPDSAQIIINGEVYFDLHGKTVQPKIFTVDIDKTDNTTEFAFVFTQEDDYSFIRIFRYKNRYVSEFGGMWGKLDNEFAGIGMVAEFPGDGSVATYAPGDEGFKREIVYPEEQHGVWLGGICFY